MTFCFDFGKMSISISGSAKFTQNRGYRFNITMTMKMDFMQLMSNDESLVNHTKILQKMVISVTALEPKINHLFTHLSCLIYHTKILMLIKSFCFGISLIGDWSFAFRCLGVLPRLLVSASKWNCNLSADWQQFSTFIVQRHSKAASSPKTHPGFIPTSGRWVKYTSSQ